MHLHSWWFFHCNVRFRGCSPQGNFSKISMLQDYSHLKATKSNQKHNTSRSIQGKTHHNPHNPGLLNSFVHQASLMSEVLVVQNSRYAQSFWKWHSSPFATFEKKTTSQNGSSSTAFCSLTWDFQPQIVMWKKPSCLQVPILQLEGWENLEDPNETFPTIIGQQATHLSRLLGRSP